MERLQDYLAVFSNAWQQADGVSLLLFGLYFLTMWIVATLYETYLKTNNED